MTKANLRAELIKCTEYLAYLSIEVIKASKAPSCKIDVSIVNKDGRCVMNMDCGIAKF